jgi:hypothetical protein
LARSIAAAGRTLFDRIEKHPAVLEHSARQERHELTGLRGVPRR